MKDQDNIVFRHGRGGSDFSLRPQRASATLPAGSIAADAAHNFPSPIEQTIQFMFSFGQAVFRKRVKGQYLG
jgi:hypothetical protein